MWMHISSPSSLRLENTISMSYHIEFCILCNWILKHFFLKYIFFSSFFQNYVLEIKENNYFRIQSWVIILNVRLLSMLRIYFKSWLMSFNNFFSKKKKECCLPFDFFFQTILSIFIIWNFIIFAFPLFLFLPLFNYIFLSFRIFLLLLSTCKSKSRSFLSLPYTVCFYLFFSFSFSIFHNFFLSYILCIFFYFITSFSSISLYSTFFFLPHILSPL